MKNTSTCAARSCFMAILLALPGVCAGGNAPQYSVTDIGSAGENIIGLGINASGQVTGFFAGSTGQRAFLYTKGSAPVEFRTLGGGNSIGYAINAQGQVSGISDTTNSGSHAFLYTPGDNSIVDLQTLGGTQSGGEALNDLGIVAGGANVAGDLATHAFIYTSPGPMTDLNSIIGGVQSVASGINVHGDITGVDVVGGSGGPGQQGARNAFIYNNTTKSAQTFDVFGGNQSYGTAINDNGQVVGYGYFPNGTVYRAFLYDNGPRILATLGGSSNLALAINSLGDVTGASSLVGDTTTHAFLYTAGSMYDLNELITSDPLAPYINLAVGYGINANGQIVADGYDSRDSSGAVHAFVLTPTTSCGSGNSLVAPGDIRFRFFGASRSNQPTEIHATFKPSAGRSLANLAAACGFAGFDWVQIITNIPSPSRFAAQSDPNTKIVIPPQAPIHDPPKGGYTYADSRKPPFAGAFPYYYNTGSVPGECASRSLSDGSCLVYITGDNGFALNFVDAPKDPCLLTLGPYSVCLGRLQGLPYLMFTTQLVGVCAATSQPLCPDGPGQPSVPLFQWTWKDNFAGIGSGGIDSGQTASIYPVDPSTGSGGVTVTSVNGVEQAPPAVSCSATPTTLWPPDGKEISVAVSGTVGAGTSPLDPSSPAFNVVDSEGQTQPSGSVTVGSDGSYAFNVPLIASRDGNNQSGREYTIWVSVGDTFGNVGTCSAIVTVPHDRGH